MGKGHIAVNKYMSDKARFADLVNGKLFGGEQVVLSEELEKVDGESEILLEDKNGKTSQGVFPTIGLIWWMRDIWRISPASKQIYKR